MFLSRGLLLCIAAETFCPRCYFLSLCPRPLSVPNFCLKNFASQLWKAVQLLGLAQGFV